MHRNARLISYPHFFVQNDIVKTFDCLPYIVKIGYTDGSVIVIEEHDEGTVFGINTHSYVIKKERMLFPQIIYKGSTDGSNWDILSNFPVDKTTNQPASTTLIYFLRYLLCKHFKIDSISPSDNPQFEEFFSALNTPETGIPNVQRVSYLKDLPPDFLPAPFLNITTAAALVCGSSTEFKELFPAIIKRVQQLKNKHDDESLNAMW